MIKCIDYSIRYHKLDWRHTLYVLLCILRIDVLELPQNHPYLPQKNTF